MIRPILLVACAGCLDRLGPEVGPPQQIDPSCDADSDAEHTVSFATEILGGVLQRNHCLTCHTPTGETPIGLQQSGLDMSSYTKLRAGGGRSGASIIIDDKPCESILYQKIGPSPPFGSRMPLNLSPVPHPDQLLLHDWIAEGAHDN